MIHRVRQGDCISSLAARYGFESWRSIYEHPSNADLRKTRPNPDLLYPGDEVFVPEVTTKVERCATGASHVFQVKRPKVNLRVVLCDDGDRPIADKRYVLRGPEVEREGRTDAGGLVEQPIPASLRSADLLVWLDDDGAEPDLEYTLLLGQLDPVETLTGVLARLHNLGYDCAVAGGINDGQTLAAVRAFRRHQGLPDGEAIDEVFRERLRIAHDGG